MTDSASPVLSPAEVGAVARKRRRQLGRTQIQVATVARAALGEGALSEPTVRNLEAGKDVSDRKLAAVSIGLDWPADGLERVRAGEDPATITATVEDVDAATVTEMFEELRSEMRRLHARLDELQPPS